MSLIWVVSSNYWLVEEDIRPLIKKLYPEAEVWTCYRDYHFEGAIRRGEKPDLIITDGLCKTRPEWEPTDTVGIYYDEPRRFGMRELIPVISPTFFGISWISMLKLKLWFYRHRLNPTTTSVGNGIAR